MVEIKNCPIEVANDIWNAAIEQAAREIVIPNNFDLECKLAAKIRSLKK